MSGRDLATCRGCMQVISLLEAGVTEERRHRMEQVCAAACKQDRKPVEICKSRNSDLLASFWEYHSYEEVSTPKVKALLLLATLKL